MSIREFGSMLMLFMVYRSCQTEAKHQTVQFTARVKNSLTVCLAGISLLSGPRPILAADIVTAPSIQTISQYYDKYSESYDRLDGGSLTRVLGIDEMRETAGKFVTGKVLEVAVGTGLQSKFYDWDLIQSFTGIDLSNGMLQEANKRILAEAKARSARSIKIELSAMNAESLNFKDNEFDTVIDTFSMCVVADPSKAVNEMRRVVKADGKVILLENSISTNPLLAAIQNAFEPVITPYSKGCRWNVDIPRIAKSAGLEKELGNDIQLGTIMLGMYRKP